MGQGGWRSADPMSSKLRMVKRWVAQYMGDIEHELRVAALAVRLYDLTQPLHRLNGFHRRMVELGAVAHDIGRCIDDKDHPEHGARMVMEEASLPLTDQERRCVAYLTRYHRGKAPRLGQDDVLQRGDDRGAMLLALAVLKAADALDGRNLPSPRVTFALRGRKLRICCQVDRGAGKAGKVYCRPHKLRLLEKLLDCEIALDISQRRRPAASTAA